MHAITLNALPMAAATARGTAATHDEDTGLAIGGAAWEP